MAANVDGIDVIISGHTHSTLTEPIIVNDTYVVSAGEYSKALDAYLEAYKSGNMQAACRIGKIYLEVKARPRYIIEKKTDEMK